MANNERLRIKTQQTLVDFLRTDLDVGRTFVHIALSAKDEGDMDHCARSKHKATKAAATIRRFVKQVADDRTRTQIVNKLAELDRLISTI